MCSRMVVEEPRDLDGGTSEEASDPCLLVPIIKSKGGIKEKKNGQGRD